MTDIYHTVSVLSVNLPCFAQILLDNYSFHNYRISDCVLAGYHVLALDETRAPHEMEQVCFSGSHADIRGHLFGTKQRGHRPICP